MPIGIVKTSRSTDSNMSIHINCQRVEHRRQRDLQSAAIGNNAQIIHY